MFDLSKFKLNLKVIIKDAKLILLEMSEIFEYNEKKEKTNKLLGYKALVGNAETFERYNVKILNTSPSLTLDDFKNASPKLEVEFDNAEAGFYRLPGGEWELYVRATDIRIAGSNETSNGSALKSIGNFLDSAKK